MPVEEVTHINISYTDSYDNQCVWYHHLQIADDADNYLPESDDEDNGEPPTDERQQMSETLFPAKGKPPFFPLTSAGAAKENVASPSSVTSKEVETTEI